MLALAGTLRDNKMAVMRIFSPGHFCQQVRQMLRRAVKARSTQECIEETVFFTSPLTLDASKGEVVSLDKQAGQRWQLEVSMPALTGAYGALPSAYTEWLAERYFRYGDPGAKAFLDIFNHRLCSLYYLSWQKNRCYVEAEQNDNTPLTHMLSSLLHLPEMSHFQPERIGGLLTSPVRSQVNLERLLQIICRCPAEVRSFTGCWTTLAEGLQARLGLTNMILGQSPALGHQFWDRAGHFTVTLGPMSGALAAEFLAGRMATTVHQQIREYVGPILRFSLEVVVVAPPSPVNYLGAGSLGYGFSLGSNDVGLYQRFFLPDIKQEN